MLNQFPFKWDDYFWLRTKSLYNQNIDKLKVFTHKNEKTLVMLTTFLRLLSTTATVTTMLGDSDDDDSLLWILKKEAEGRNWNESFQYFFSAPSNLFFIWWELLYEEVRTQKNDHQLPCWFVNCASCQAFWLTYSIFFLIRSDIKTLKNDICVAWWWMILKSTQNAIIFRAD